jgi:NDP-sugar pyrophosphorylase family protein
MAKPESYQAVVLAGGRGNRMINLTDYLEKSLLPVANIPMFWFPLNMLYRNGFRGFVYHNLHFPPFS